LWATVFFFLMFGLLQLVGFGYQMGHAMKTAAPNPPTLLRNGTADPHVTTAGIPEPPRSAAPGAPVHYAGPLSTVFSFVELHWLTGRLLPQLDYCRYGFLEGSNFSGHEQQKEVWLIDDTLFHITDGYMNVFRDLDVVQPKEECLEALEHRFLLAVKDYRRTIQTLLMDFTPCNKALAEDIVGFLADNGTSLKRQRINDWLMGYSSSSTSSTERSGTTGVRFKAHWLEWSWDPTTPIEGTPFEEEHASFSQDLVQKEAAAALETKLKNHLETNFSGDIYISENRWKDRVSFIRKCFVPRAKWPEVKVQLDDIKRKNIASVHATGNS